VEGRGWREKAKSLGFSLYSLLITYAVVVKLYLLRHAQSIANVEHVFSNHGLKHPLTDLGRKQAYEVARRLEVLPIEAIYTSPILRAIETTVVVAHKLRLNYQIEPDLREIDAGIFENRSTVHEGQEYWQVMQRWLSGEHEVQIEGGETRTAVMARAAAFLEQIVSSQKPSLAITHGGFLTHGVAPLCGLKLTQAQIEGLYNTALVELERRDGAWHCLTWAGVPVSPRV
jgi:broad specificity phosphatase PhoE